MSKEATDLAVMVILFPFPFKHTQAQKHTRLLTPCGPTLNKPQWILNYAETLNRQRAGLKEEALHLAEIYDGKRVFFWEGSFSRGANYQSAQYILPTSSTLLVLIAIYQFTHQPPYLRELMQGMFSETSGELIITGKPVTYLLPIILRKAPAINPKPSTGSDESVMRAVACKKPVVLPKHLQATDIF